MAHRQPPGGASTRISRSKLRQRDGRELQRLYKWELIYRHGPWRGLDDVEFATLSYVDWFNQRRLHGEIAEHGYVTPAEFEAAYYRQSVSATQAGTQ